jgi:hypothetical protein
MSRNLSYSFTAKSFGSKILIINDEALFACAGSSAYIDEFTTLIQESIKRRKPPQTYRQALNKGILKYDVWMKEKVLKNYPQIEGLESRIAQMYPSGIFIGFDARASTNPREKYQVFEIATPDIAEQTKSHEPIAVGSGSETCYIFFESLKSVMSYLQIEWTDLSYKVVSQFCWVFQRQISQLDRFTSGTEVYLLQESKPRKIEQNEAFDIPEGKDGLEKWYMEYTQFPKFLETLLDEIEPAKLKQFIDGGKWKRLIDAIKRLPS